MNKKWKYCAPAHGLIEFDLQSTPEGKAYEDKLNKQRKLYRFVCDELPDDVFSGGFHNMLIEAYVYYNIDKNYEKRDQCIRKSCSYLPRVNKNVYKEYNGSLEKCFEDMKKVCKNKSKPRRKI